ncbi:transporter substrate-binding domain-containing protein [Candidatus Accumulibacter phosphatis]
MGVRLEVCDIRGSAVMKTRIRSQACGLLLLALASGVPAQAGERALRVAILSNSPPMSYTDETGKPAGFNVGVAHALCEEMKVRCELTVVELADVVDAVAAGEFDFSAVSLLATPARQARVLFSKPYYHSNSIWFAKPGVEPGAATARVAAVAGSAQHRYARAQGWQVSTVNHHSELPALLSGGKVNAVLMPMATALTLREDPLIQPLGLQTTVLQAPELSGEVCFSVDPRNPELRDRINAAFDRIKRDGRFDRLNTEHLPFRLQ